MASTIVNTKPAAALASLLHRPELRRLLDRLRHLGRHSTQPPDGTPYQRSPADIEPADAYGCHGSVWVYFGSSWHRGIILKATRHSALVCYEIPGQRDIGVESLTATQVMRRLEPPHLRREPNEARIARARATLLIHRADEDGLCAQHAELAQFCWFPCPDAKAALAELAELARRQLRLWP